jgi:hypothetical protein
MVLVGDLVHGDQGSDNVCHSFKTLEEVLVVSQPLPHGEAFDVLELHIGGRLGQRQHNGRSSMDAALDCCSDPCLRTKEALLPAPRWSTHVVGQDIGGTTEGLHLHEQLCSK